MTERKSEGTVNVALGGKKVDGAYQAGGGWRNILLECT
jgi:hypothetical protein